MKMSGSNTTPGLDSGCYEKSELDGITPLYLSYIIIPIIIPMDPSTFLGSVWGIIYYNLVG